MYNIGRVAIRIYAQSAKARILTIFGFP